MELFPTPNFNISNNNLPNLLYGNYNEKLEKELRTWVGAESACSCHSATMAIMLLLQGKNAIIEIPTMIPPVVANAIILGGNKIRVVDNPSWVGSPYIIEAPDIRIIDSAQAVDYYSYNRLHKNDSDVMLLSFYPTKPLGGADGGMILSNDSSITSLFRELINNGASVDTHSWNRVQNSIGYKAYMSNLQSKIVYDRFITDFREEQKEQAYTRDTYNHYFTYQNKSTHLYTIYVENREETRNLLLDAGIPTGIHYKCIHEMPVFKPYIVNHTGKLAKSTWASKHTISIPFSPNNTIEEYARVIAFITKHTRMIPREEVLERLAE